MKRQRLQRDALINAALMKAFYQTMPESERAALAEWERQYVDGSGRVATSDWPGWEKYIGVPPNGMTS